MSNNGSGFGDHAGALYVGYGEKVPEPPRDLCRTCEDLPYPVPEGAMWTCKFGMRPKSDGSCRFYQRVPGSDDE